LATTFGLPATGGAAASFSANAFDTDGHNPDDGNNTASHDGTLTVTATDGSSTATTVDADGSVSITNANGSTMTAYAVANDDGSTTILLAGSSAVGERADCNTVTMLALGDTAAAKPTNNDGRITMAVTLPDGSTETVPDAGNGGGGGGGEGGGGGGVAEIELELTAAAHDGSVATTAADSSTYTHNDNRLVQMLYMTDDEREGLHFDLVIPDLSLASVQVKFY
jgi:hypothetical protein